MRKLPLAALAALLVVPAARPAEAPDRLDNWPHWRGPLATGEAPRGEPPLKWDEKTNVRWKVELPGQGASTPIVWGDQVFVLTAVDTGVEAKPADLPRPDPRFKRKTTAPNTYHQFLVVAYDRKTGKERWRHVAAERVPHEGHHATHSYAAGSPVTDGRHLYVSFGSFGVYCYDLDGKQKWARDLGRFNTRLGWGEASTPAVRGDTVVLNCDQEAGSFVVALDARTGAVRWKKERDEPSSWSTPLIVEHKGRAQVVLNAMKKVRSYDLADGKLLWQCGGGTLNSIPSPVPVGELVVCMSGYKGAFAAAIRLDAKGDVTDSEKAVVWRHGRGTPYVPSPLLVGGRLYFTHLNGPLFSCLDVRSGKVVFDRSRLPALRDLYASPVAAAGRIYLADRDGTCVVVAQGERPRVLAVNRLEDGFSASPAVVGRQLFLRGEKYLYCLEGR
jgi:outer membrane protein assembly factor BamB